MRLDLSGCTGLTGMSDRLSGAGQLYTPEEIPPVPTTYSDTIPELCVVRKMSLY